MKKHFYCEGDCGGESDKPGVCMAAGCIREDQPLKACECDDGSHAKILEDSSTEENEELAEEDLVDGEHNN